MATFTGFLFNGTPASNTNWFLNIPGYSTLGIAVNATGDMARITNWDGSWTVLHGDAGAFSIDGQGKLQGTIKWLSHTTAGTASFTGMNTFEAFGSATDVLNIDANSFAYSSTYDRFNATFGRPGVILNGDDGHNVLSGGAFADIFNGGGGSSDTADYRFSPTGIVADLAYLVTATGFAAGDVYNSIESLAGSNALDGDQLYGDGNNNLLNCYDGNDFASGRGGNDTVWGGSGDDVLAGGTGNDQIDGGNGDDFISFQDAAINGVVFNLADGGAGVAAVSAELGTDTYVRIEHVEGSDFDDNLAGNNSGNIVRGRSGYDTIYGLDGNDTLYGDAGNDTIYGDGNWNEQGGSQTIGDDTIYGGIGSDTIFAGLGNNSIDGGADSDTLDYSGLLDDFGNSTFYIIADLSAGLVTLYSVDAFDGAVYLQGTDTVTSTEWLKGTVGDDTITDSMFFDVIQGGYGNDRFNLAADNASDAVLGEGGFDTLSLQFATSAVTVRFSNPWSGSTGGGGLGNTTFDSMDAVWGSTFNDRMTGTRETQTLKGEGGNDIIAGGAGADTLDGGAGNDLLTYDLSKAAVSIDLGTGAASGGHATGDVISNFERVIGSDYNDTLAGNALNNTLTGALGRDTLTGGAGRDTFVYNSVAESAFAAAGRDVITDFLAGLDKISLTAIDANADGGTANDAFTFLTSGPITGLGQIRVTHTLTTTVIDINTTGTTDADMRITLTGNVAIGAGDFLL